MTKYFLRLFETLILHDIIQHLKRAFVALPLFSLYIFSPAKLYVFDNRVHIFAIFLYMYTHPFPNLAKLHILNIDKILGVQQVFLYYDLKLFIKK